MRNLGLAVCMVLLLPCMGTIVTAEVVYQEDFSNGPGEFDLRNDDNDKVEWIAREDCPANGESGHSIPGTLRWGAKDHCDNYQAGPSGTADFTASPVINVESCTRSVILSFNYFLDFEDEAPFDFSQAGINCTSNGVGTLLASNAPQENVSLLENDAEWHHLKIDLGPVGPEIEVGFFAAVFDEINNGGEGFHVDDVTVSCNTKGACCLNTESCLQLQADECEDLGGTFAGEGVACDRDSVLDVVVAPDRAIPDDDPNGIIETFTVDDSFIIEDLDVDLLIAHKFVGDLIVSLTHVPSGKTAVLIERPGQPSLGLYGCDGGGYNVIVDDEGVGGSIQNICERDIKSPPNYTPHEPLSVFDGINAQGDWVLFVSDNSEDDKGKLVQWSLHFGETSCPVTLLATVSAFDAKITRRGVQVRWATSLEIDHVGFRLLRSIDGGEPEVVGPIFYARGSESYGAEYEYFDARRVRGEDVRYFLEDINTLGQVTRNGPAVAARSSFRSLRPSRAEGVSGVPRHR